MQGIYFDSLAGVAGEQSPEPFYRFIPAIETVRTVSWAGPFSLLFILEYSSIEELNSNSSEKTCQSVFNLFNLPRYSSRYLEIERQIYRFPERDFSRFLLP